jgi:hypothetical protein
MLSFSQFMSEQTITKKVFIEHLDKMKPIKFLEFASKLDKEFGGVLSKESLSITEKIDGSALRIGQDVSGRPFIESSRSPSTFHVGEFTQRDISKGYSGAIGKNFDAILKEIKQDKQFQSVLSKYNLGKGIKVIGEVLYVPMGIDEVDKIKFIKISYAKSMLGSLITFIPFEVVDLEGRRHSDEKKVLSELYAISNKKRKIAKPSIRIDRDIDISLELKDFNTNITKKYENIEQILSSRKKVDAELKNYLKAQIAEYQKRIAAKILSYIKSGSLGSEYEGIVIKMNDGSILKIVTDTFKNREFKSL